MAILLHSVSWDNEGNPQIGPVLRSQDLPHFATRRTSRIKKNNLTATLFFICTGFSRNASDLLFLKALIAEWVCLFVCLF